MAAADYSADIASALSSIREAGMDLKLRVPTTVVDPVTQAPTGDPDEHDCVGVVFPISQSTLGQMSREIRAKLRNRRAYEFLVAAGELGLHPKPGDTVGPYLGIHWEVVGINTLAPSGVAIIHQILAAA